MGDAGVGAGEPRISAHLVNACARAGFVPPATITTKSVGR